MKSALIAMGLLISPVSGSSNDASIPVFQNTTLHQWIRLQIEQDFSMREHLTAVELQDLVSGAIQDANPELEGLPFDHPKRLTRDLIQVTQCLGIDPVIFTALIWRESNFKPQAVSETGAVGLTQMTMTGVQEVLERTHHHGYRRLKYARELFKKCAPSVFRNLPDEVTPKSIAHTKTIISISTLDGMVFGAFLLKLNLAGIRQSTHRLNRYQTALELYNGDPKVKSEFARDILAKTKKLLKQPSVALNE